MDKVKDLDYYLGLPYTFELIREDDVTWFARVKELRGCMTEGDGAEDAVEMLQDAMRGWLEVALEEGLEIPEPASAPDYSGRFNLRVARSLHRDLAIAAEREGVSLNQWIATVLAREVARADAQPATGAAASSPTRRKQKTKSAAREQSIAVHERPAREDLFQAG